MTTAWPSLRNAPIALVVAAAFSAPGVLAATPPSAVEPSPSVGASLSANGTSTDTAEPFDLAADPDFANYRRAVTDYLASRRAHAVAHVCVLGERVGGVRRAAVWWREGARLIEWDGRDARLAASASNLDLRRDIVATEDDLHGSTYLVTRAWVAGFEQRCTRDGVSFVVQPGEIRAFPQARRDRAP